MPTIDPQRIYTVLDRIEKTVGDNHTEVVQRLTTLEARQHYPEDCPGIENVSDRLDDHIKDVKEAKRDAKWKSLAKEALRLLAAVAAALGMYHVKK